VIPGFVVDGTAARTYLIRAVGPALAGFGVDNPLADPQLTVYRDGVLISTNDNWSDSGTAAQTETLANALGAFALPANSNDAAVTLALTPGAYTVHVTGNGNTGGSVLVEIYAVP
jgi:hypothetical protein